MIFSVKKHDDLRAGALVDKDFPTKQGDFGIYEPAPFRIGQLLAARRDGSRRATLKAEVRDVQLVPDGDGKAWRVTFGKAVAPHDLRLLSPGRGFTSNPDRMMGAHDPDSSDAGEAPPADPHRDLAVKQAMAKREAAIENAVGSVELLNEIPEMSREDKRRIRRAMNDLQRIRENNASGTRAA